MKTIFPLFTSAFLFAWLAVSSSPVHADDWPVVRGNAQATGVSQGTLPQDLDRLWEFRVKDSGFDTTPAIVDGVVYLGDFDGVFFALRLADGKEIWRHETDSSFSAGAAVKDGRVYVGDLDGRFYCFDAETGKPLWAFEADSVIDRCANFYQDKVLFGCQDNRLYCLDAKTGKLVWKHEIDDQIRCSPSVAGDRAFLGGCDSKLHVIDIENGKNAGAVKVGVPVGSTPALRDGLAYFVASGGELYAVDWKNLAVEWTEPPSRGGSQVETSAAVTDELVIYSSGSRQMRAVDRKTGEERWTFSARRTISASPVVVGDRVFFGALDGRVYGLSLADGKKVWEYETGGGFAASAAVSNGRLVIANDEGNVFCFGAK